MVLPSNGAGITTAMIGGRVAGQAIANHIIHDKSLTEYEKNGYVIVEDLLPKKLYSELLECVIITK